jgi:hypothetical protein
MTETDSLSVRALNVVLAPGSSAHRHVPHPHPQPHPTDQPPSHDLAPGFQPQPTWNLANLGGRVISDLVFVNRYVGGAAAWSASDMANIDDALSKAMTDAGLQSVIAQYFPGGQISSTMLPSSGHDHPAPGTVYKDTAEALATQLHSDDASASADPANTVINIMLPQGVVLSDDFSPGFRPPVGQEHTHSRRKVGVIRVDEDDAADSKHGLGGYHGSVHLPDGTEIYYAVGVYSEGDNGISAFDQPWKNVVATFYHELNEARTDADVEDVNATGDNSLLGWYSQTGQGEIGDLPINACNGDLGLVFKELPLADQSGTVPIQLMWSNADAGPAGATSVGQAAIPA